MESALPRPVHIAVDRVSGTRLGDELHLHIAALPECVVNRRRARLTAVREVGADEVAHDDERASAHHRDPMLEAIIEIGHDERGLEHRVPQQAGCGSHRSIVTVGGRPVRASRCIAAIRGPLGSPHPSGCGAAW